MNLSDFWNQYTQYLSHNVRPSTQAARCWAFSHFLESLHPKSLHGLTAAQIESHKIAMTPKWSAHTWNDFARNMHTIYQDAARMGHFTGGNPWKLVKSRPLPRTKKRTLTVEERNHLLEVAQEHAKHPKADRIDYMIALMVLAGLRKGEAIACRWEWFDWGKRTLNVFEGDRDLKTVGIVPISARLQEALGYPGVDNVGFVYRDTAQEHGSGRYRVEFRKSFNTVKQNAGLDWVTPHILRHTFGSLLLDAGVEIHKVSKWMRHSSIKVTADIYYHNQGYDDEINACA